MSSMIASVSPLKTTPPRIDALAEFDRPAAAPIDLRQATRTLLAWLLVGAGVGVSVWLVYVLHAVLFRPDSVGLIRRLVPAPEELVLTIPAGKIELPPGVMPAVVYVLLIVTFGIATRVAAGLIKEGTWLARQDPTPDRKPPAPPAADKTPSV
jgi:hypothetical protein